MGPRAGAKFMNFGSFSSFSDFIQMGEHGLFVWSCYGLTLVVLVVNIIRPLQLQRRLIKEKRLAIDQEGAHSQTPSARKQVNQ